MPPRTELLHTVADNITTSLPLNNSNHSSNGSSDTPSSSSTQLQSEVRLHTPSGRTTEVKVEHLTSALGREIAELRAELTTIRSQKRQKLQSNLHTYINALPQHSIDELNNDITSSILLTITNSTDKLYTLICDNNIKNKKNEEIEGSQIAIEGLQITISYMLYICMVQISTGYKLRELKEIIHQL